MMLYDSRHRSQENMLSTSTSVIADYLYQEDAVGNITQIHDATNAAYNRDFGYDDLNRLATANTGSSLWGTGGYQYDAMGNMTSLHVGSRSLSFAYAGTTARIQSVSGTNPETVTYDNAGNEVTVGRYSPRNLLEGIGNGDPRMEPGLSLGYSYDGRGVRILTSLTTPGMPPWGGTKTRRSVYSPELHLLSQSAWSGEDVELGERAGRSSNLATRTRSPRVGLTLAAIRPTTAIPIGGSSVGTDYIWFAGQPVAQAFTGPSEPVRYTFTDHLGTPILQTDATAAVVWRVEYEPYGSIYSYRVGDANDPQVLRLPGQEAPESLNTAGYNIFRWYRAEWGRYTQADPLPSLDVFGYADLNPMRYIDPMGLRTTFPPPSQLPAPRTVPPPDCLPKVGAPPAIPWGGALGYLTVVAAFLSGTPGGGSGDTIGDPLRRCDSCDEDQKKHDDDCEKILDADIKRCEIWWLQRKTPNARNFAACRQAAMTRYSECLVKGSPISPLSPHPFQY
jgi:RHS repeat-associated protein